jgi:hypothetical protein
VENEFGEPSLTQLADSRKLTAHPPRLLFLSACKPAETDGVVESLTRSCEFTRQPSRWLPFGDRAW